MKCYFRHSHVQDWSFEQMFYWKSTLCRGAPTTFKQGWRISLLVYTWGKNTLWKHTHSTTTLYKNFGSKIVCVLPKKCIFSNCTRYNLKNTLFEKVHPRRKHFENIRINHNFYVCVDMPSNLSHVLFRIVGIAKL